MILFHYFCSLAEIIQTLSVNSIHLHSSIAQCILMYIRNRSLFSKNRAEKQFFFRKIFKTPFSHILNSLIVKCRKILFISQFCVHGRSRLLVADHQVQAYRFGRKPNYLCQDPEREAGFYRYDVYRQIVGNKYACWSMSFIPTVNSSPIAKKTVTITSNAFIVNLVLFKLASMSSYGSD